jgi:acetyltransferase-like isoleucine patch superfamily enzyme
MTWKNDHLENDWFHRAIPENVELGANVYIDSSYVFARFFSSAQPGLVVGEGSGAYGMASFSAGLNARITVGAYTCLNCATVEAETEVRIGSHCLFAWGSYISDAKIPSPRDVSRRREAMMEMARAPLRRQAPLSEHAPVRIDDNVWIGFHSVVLGGVTIGRGAVIGCKTAITENVPPYAVVVGNPPRIVRLLEADDTEEVRLAALREFGLAPAVAAG